jgi:hypothetical protein
MSPLRSSGEISETSPSDPMNANPCPIPAGTEAAKTTTVLAHADGERAGLVSGALSTMQQAGNALGVALRA